MYNISHNFTYRQKDKGWQVILSYKDGGKWRQKSKQGLSTKREAKQAGEKLLADVAAMLACNPISPELVDISLKDFAAYTFRSRNLSYNSTLAYSYALRAFGDTLLSMPVHKITYLDLQRAVKGWTCSVASCRLYIACIKMILNQAVEPYHIRTDNPAKYLKPPKDGKKKTVHALTKKQLYVSFEQLRAVDYRYVVVCALAGLAGLRFGEILGLTWDDIDFKSNVIHVTKQYGRIAPGKKGTRKIKNGSIGCRTLPMPAKLTQILRDYKQTQPPTFSRSIWTDMPNNDTISNHLKKIVPGATVHSLRHTYATMLLANGADIKTVSALIGDTVATVLNVYIDYTDDMRKQAADKVNEIFA